MSYQPPVCSTPTFERHCLALAPRYPALREDIAHLAELLTLQPTQGELLGGTLYWAQLPLAAKPKAKRLGVVWAVRRGKVFLLLAFELRRLAGYEEPVLDRLRAEGTRLMLET
ncbi:MAG: hypothetical protein SFY70_02850 [Bacteroidia bacterium]|nr:hypothetical protein [Bacteroidia bacterium]